MSAERVGRYELGGELARGGMGVVRLGRVVADGGFSRIVAIKRVLVDVRSGSSFDTRALQDEARLLSRIRHPHVIATLDFVVDPEGPALILEYVAGESLSELLRAARALNEPLAANVVARIVSDMLKGLHAAHEARDADGVPLGIVHRDVSPQNVLVGVDGLARLLDFGIARALRRAMRTETGIVKGKAIYMPPEQVRGLPVTRQADVFAAGKVLGEATDDKALASIVKTATAPEARDRFATAAEMAAAIEDAISCASADEVGRVVERLAADALEARAELVAKLERATPINVAVSGVSVAARSVVVPLTDPARDTATTEIDAPTAEMTDPEAHIETEATPIAPAPISAPYPVATKSTPQRGMMIAAAALLAVCLVYAFTRAPANTPIASTATSATFPPPVETIAPPVDTARADIQEEPADPTPHQARTPPAPKRRPPRAKPSAAPDCNPPYVISDDGKRHYRPECLPH